MITSGVRARIEQITVMPRLLLKRRTSQMESNWKILVIVGKPASKQI
jgi:hypothetical protein